ncbi:MAG: hypothetical protein CSA20_04455 [Deltaproteobacteria bacterium]|nr:MAG: hypothetical protein CSA20_04455 [Deltaproteobacteria bacterium]
MFLFDVFLLRFFDMFKKEWRKVSPGKKDQSPVQDRENWIILDDMDGKRHSKQTETTGRQDLFDHIPDACDECDDCDTYDADYEDYEDDYADW